MTGNVQLNGTLMIKIGYFGDSFCESKANDSWCVLLADRLNAEVVNWGSGGASIWKTFMEYESFKEKDIIPDISVFCWTEPYRLYHPRLPIAKGAVPIPGEDEQVYKAADMYYVHLQNYRKEELAYSYALQWFDRHVLAENKKQILQTWSMKPFELAGKNVDIKLTSGKFRSVRFHWYRPFYYIYSSYGARCSGSPKNWPVATAQTPILATQKRRL